MSNVKWQKCAGNFLGSNEGNFTEKILDGIVKSFRHEALNRNWFGKSTIGSTKGA